MLRALFLLFILFLNSCATPYQTGGAMGGFYETQLDENVFRVEFKGNAYTSMNKAVYFTLLRSAELTIENGYNYFVIVDENRYTKSSTNKLPSTTYHSGTIRDYGNKATYKGTSKTYGGQTITSYRPRSSNTFVMFRYEPQIDGYFYDARFVAQSIREEFNL